VIDTNKGGLYAEYDKLLNASQAADLLSLKLSTIRRLTYERALPVIRPTGKRAVRYRLSDLESLLKKRSQPNAGRRAMKTPEMMNAQEHNAQWKPGPIIVCLSEVKSEAVNWLWPHYIPGGKLTLLIGDPGLGKSFLTLDLASRVSAGTSWPDGTTGVHGNVVLLTAEDGLGDTVRPRLDVAGADTSRVFAITGVRRKENAITDLVQLGQDLQPCGIVLKETQARLVIIDPLSAYLGNTE